jgi:hypothetical protein
MTVCMVATALRGTSIFKYSGAVSEHDLNPCFSVFSTDHSGSAV